LYRRNLKKIWFKGDLLLSNDKIQEWGEPAPLPSNHEPVWYLVIKDMNKRNEFGRKKYGTPLKAFNGRDVLKDAYEEALDLVVYLRQAIYERDSENK
jgi:hypothetical protein